MRKTGILIVEDDGELRSGLIDLLGGAGFDCTEAAGFREALRIAEEREFDICLLDVILGDGSGVELCRLLRERTAAPIIFLTALDGEDQVIEGLGAGADDYIEKPFRAGELLARLNANLRRHPPKTDAVESGDVVFIPSEQKLFIRGEECRFPPAETKLLALFLESGGKLLRREKLLYELWDADGEFVDENTLTVLVSRLRRELAAKSPIDYIETVRGAGYRWKPACFAGERRQP